MATISESEFARICQGIADDHETIIKHNPFGTDEEILLWMLMMCLLNYLSLSEIETPCFTGTPNAETYRNAILFILKDRKIDNFEAEIYLEKLKD